MKQDIVLNDVEKSLKRLKGFIKQTPVLSNQILNQKIGAQVFFKCENLQETNSFKARGAFNALLSYKEKHGSFPKKIVAQSSGNHAQAVAFAAKKFGLNALIFMAKNTSPVKIKATQDLGAQVVICEKRSEVNRKAEEKINEGYFFIHPSANDDVICGQATSTYEALQEIQSRRSTAQADEALQELQSRRSEAQADVDAVFTPVGGGGLVSGAYLAAQGFSDKIKVFGCEPKNANDAKISVRDNKIFAFSESPNTIADGARTLCVLEPCFTYLKKLSDILEITEEEIIFWQKTFVDATNIAIEPTSALAVAGAYKYAQENKISSDKKLLVIISGGNV